ncbi:sugar ABC transporter ATP-binding protein [Sphaerisporangium fuscum]|uniref:sugar ABC transporter ATP-binding protein n=1 Tax=Sphaerisporangium fuscum TaxID=2835868 RepID=UPI001BDC6500|nr:sugar ABC transporter ATP-binding protein [Sphaerisporangium fuscum]
MALQVAGVTKGFPGVRALDHVSMSVAEGEVHALIGGNGAGKSTLVNVLSGVCRPDGGELRLFGEPVSFAGPLQALRAGVATIYQKDGLAPQLSVARTVFLGREPRGRFGLIDFARMHAEAEEILTGYGLRVDVRRPVGSLPAGTQQMVALARAASTGARIVVMDEPTTSMEPGEVEALFGVIAGLRESGRSVVYVSHRLEELYRVCDRVTVLRDGKVVHTGTMDGLDRFRLVSLMLGRPYHPPSPAADPGDGPADEPGDLPVLEATDLRRRHVLAGISIALRPGEVVGLGGLLGDGRSETARALAGVEPVETGQVTVAGIPLRDWSVRSAIRAGVGLVPENRRSEGIVPSLSVRDNIALAALPRLSRVGIVSDARVDRIVATFMRRLRIKAVSPAQRAGELSGGNQQKVLLARWLAMNPKVLLLDEPSQGVDLPTRAEMQTLIDELAVDGLAVLLVSSDVAELVENCDRVVVLREGAVVRELTGWEVTEDNIMSAIAAPAGSGAIG